MRRIGDRSFEGAPGERARLRASTQGVAAIRVWLDGRPVARDVEFTLEATRRAAIIVAGEPGERCIVEIEPVEGEPFRDVILVTVHDPAPMHHYGFRAL